jgi:hypothetical protein
MIHAETLHFVQWNEHPREEQFMLLFQRQRKAINDGAENLKEFGNTIESLSLIYELEEDVIDGATNV